MKNYTWQCIKFTDGSNPYICKTEREFNRIKSKYVLERIGDGFWKATNKERTFANIK